MKMTFFVCLFLVSSLFSTAFAFQVGEIRFVAKVVSYDSEWVKIQTKAGDATIPRSAFRGVRIQAGQEHEVGVSKEEFDIVKLQLSRRKPAQTPNSN